MKKSLLLFAAVFYVKFTHAIPIDASNISVASGCNNDLIIDCTVNWGLHIEAPDISAVQITRSTGTSWLIRYNVYEPSATVTQTYDPDTGEPVTYTQSYSGNIWLEAPDRLSAENNLSIFTDQVNNYNSYPDSFYLGMTEFDMLNSGSASYLYSGEPDYIQSGTLLNYNALCLECSAEITLNLNGLDYSTGSLLITSLFTPASSPLLTFNEYNPYMNLYGSISSTEFHIAPVPLPAAAWLFLSGLLALTGVMSRQFRFFYRF